MRPELLKVAKAEFDDMIREGTARPSNSPWSSPLHLAPKKTPATSKLSKRTRIQGPVRPCGDYRRVNARTIPDKYPVRNIADYSNDLSGCSIFSVIDLVKAFQQIPVNPADIPKTAIVTPFGLFEFPYMSFGLRNAAQTFQHFIDEVLRGLDFCFAYIDDILVFSRTPQEHEHLRTLFQRLFKYGVVVNQAKCIFGQTEATFLGYRISATGSFPPTDRVTAIREFPRPTTFAALRRFLGTINFYRRFLPKAAELQAPLNAVLGNSRHNKGSKPVPWTPALEEAFIARKNSLAQATIGVRSLLH